MLLNVKMSDRKAIIIGGGKVALRKIKTLLAANAELFVVAPDVLEEISALGGGNRLTIRYARYRESDLEGMFLVVAATDDTVVNRQIASDALRLGKIVCVADAPETGNCRFPAVLHRGAIEIGVSTGGGCPPLSVELRDVIAALISEEYGALADQLAKEREKLLTEGNSNTYNEQILRSLAKRLISELNSRKETVR